MKSNAAKYAVRAVKYFIYIIILFSLIIAVLVFSGFVESDIDTMFRGGWRSIWQIAVLFAVVAAVYPKWGFTKRKVNIPGEYHEIRQGVLDFMAERGYKLETEDGENMTFRLRSKFSAIVKMLEDRVTFTRELGGFSVEGLTKDILRLSGGLEYKFRPADPEE